MNPVYRRDYSPPAFWISEVELEFDLDPLETLVTARLSLTRNESQSGRPLELDGENLHLRSVSIDGKELAEDEYEVTDEQLILRDLPDHFQLETKVVIAPVNNKSLSGLYQSSGNFCTQCEALGFRKITYFLDRPDVLARYRVTIRADQEHCPVVLSNGNRIEQRKLSDGRHEVVWRDPFLKPSYLFALVAGDLSCHRGTFVTQSGREVALEIWVEPENIDFCEHALQSLQKSMKWDEQKFGLEYDLDIYMIVAVNDFNMGAMENKGLNIFNSKYVLASPETATDDDYLGVEAVIAHEYFHNWTGNRVTCRDWFQLTLKEGLTVFRDQQFTADQTSAAVKRIDDVVSLRSRQFPEDAGPMSHPIRPESYISMDNFYTATVYNKGAEIIRIYHTLLGADGFRSGMDLYFERHDGTAVTCDDFRAAMADANGVSLASLDRWYSQPGTPTLNVSSEWNQQLGQFTLTCQQSYPPLPAQIPAAEGRTAVPIPIAVGLLDPQGRPLPLVLADESDQATNETTRVLLLENERESFVFTGLSSRPIPSVLRRFSAPVILKIERSDEELAFLMAHDSDSFTRWDASQSLASKVILDLTRKVQRDETLSTPEHFGEAFGKLLADTSLDGSFQSLLITLPTERVLGQQMEICDPDALHTAREFVRRDLAVRHTEKLRTLYQDLSTSQQYSLDQSSINSRRLKNTVLAYLAALDLAETTRLVSDQFRNADNMTDVQGAFWVLVNLAGEERDRAIEDFYERWNSNPLVLDKWFALQAMSKRVDTIQRVIELTSHSDFVLSNPNRVRALVGAFTQNQVRFHQMDGAGYTLLTDFVLKIDGQNPQLAARLTAALNDYRQFDKPRQALMRAQLERISRHDGLSKDVAEIVERALSF